MEENIKLGFTKMKTSVLLKTLSREEKPQTEGKYLQITYPIKNLSPKYVQKVVKTKH